MDSDRGTVVQVRRIKNLYKQENQHFPTTSITTKEHAVSSCLLASCDPYLRLSEMPCTKCRHFCQMQVLYFRDAYSVRPYCFRFGSEFEQDEKKSFEIWLKGQPVTVEPDGCPSVSSYSLWGVKGTMPWQQYQRYPSIEAFDCKQFIEDSDMVERTLMRFASEKDQEKDEK